MQEQSRMRLGLARPTPIVFATLITLVVMFVVTGVERHLGGDTIYSLLRLDPVLLFVEHRYWTLFSSALLHSLTSVSHLVFNCIALYFFGPDLEGRWGARKFVGFMALAALSGSAFVMGAHFLGLGSSPVVGASAITVGLVIAWAYTYPQREIYFFFLLPLKGIHLVYVTLGFEVLNAVSLSSVSAAAHFGGMVMGFFYGETSPGRRLYLRLRLKRLQSQSQKLAGSGAARSRAGAPPLRLIHGGQKEPPKDKRYLN
jgi:membrane associated rhomboid family serine protease